LSKVYSNLDDSSTYSSGAQGLLGIARHFFLVLPLTEAVRADGHRGEVILDKEGCVGVTFHQAWVFVGFAFQRPRPQVCRSEPLTIPLGAGE